MTETSIVLTELFFPCKEGFKNSMINTTEIVMTRYLTKYVTITSHLQDAVIAGPSTFILIACCSKNLSEAQAIVKVFFSYQTFTVTDTIPIADELYLLGNYSNNIYIYITSTYSYSCCLAISMKSIKKRRLCFLSGFFQRPWAAYLACSWDAVF